jgi:hypothetical protein
MCRSGAHDHLPGSECHVIRKRMKSRLSWTTPVLGQIPQSLAVMYEEVRGLSVIPRSIGHVYWSNKYICDIHLDVTCWTPSHLYCTVLRFLIRKKYRFLRVVTWNILVYFERRIFIASVRKKMARKVFGSEKEVVIVCYIIKYSETSICRSQIIRFPRSVIQFLWSLSESYLNYGNKTLINSSSSYRFPASVGQNF